MPHRSCRGRRSPLDTKQCTLFRTTSTVKLHGPTRFLHAQTHRLRRIKSLSPDGSSWTLRRQPHEAQHTSGCCSSQRDLVVCPATQPRHLPGIPAPAITILSRSCIPRCLSLIFPTPYTLRPAGGARLLSFSAHYTLYSINATLILTFLLAWLPTCASCVSYAVARTAVRD